MASSVIRGGFRLTSPTALLCGHPQPPFRLSLIPFSSSCRLLLVARAPPTPTYPRFVSAVGYAPSGTHKGGDQNLKRALDSEIQFAKEDQEGHSQDESVLPQNFPFTIIDRPGDQTVTLKREFGNETIEVSVFMETAEGEDQEGEEDDWDEKDGDTSSEEETLNLSDLSLIVTVEKGEGPTLEFCCTINPDEIIIDSLMLKISDVSDDQSPYEGPEFTDLDENLQKEFYNYLEHRGIKPSLASFLQDYMTKKEEREYITWLKNVKEFIEK